MEGRKALEGANLVPYSQPAFLPALTTTLSRSTGQARSQSAHAGLEDAEEDEGFMSNASYLMFPSPAPPLFHLMSALLPLFPAATIPNLDTHDPAAIHDVALHGRDPEWHVPRRKALEGLVLRASCLVPHIPSFNFPPGSACSDNRPNPRLDTHDAAGIDDTALNSRDSQQRLQDRQAVQ